MASKKKSEGQDSVSSRVLNTLPPGMREELDSCDISRLKTHIVQSTAVLRANKRAQKLDAELEAAKQRVKDLGEDYKETAAAKEAIISYSLHLLNEKGATDLGDIDL